MGFGEFNLPRRRVNKGKKEDRGLAHEGSGRSWWKWVFCEQVEAGKPLREH
jgi:hypothetical protein